jgi:hypothetical protein
MTGKRRTFDIHGNVGFNFWRDRVPALPGSWMCLNYIVIEIIKHSVTKQRGRDAFNGKL